MDEPRAAAQSFNNVDDHGVENLTFTPSVVYVKRVCGRVPDSGDALREHAQANHEFSSSNRDQDRAMERIPHALADILPSSRFCTR